jgi:hypothetical protein
MNKTQKAMRNLRHVTVELTPEQEARTKRQAAALVAMGATADMRERRVRWGR